MQQAKRKSNYRIYLVDDHQMVLDGMAALLNQLSDFELCGLATNPVMALEEIKKQQPDILITDLEMPVWTGIELTRQVKAVLPEIRVLALSMHHDYQKVSQMTEAGVQGYILKSTGKEELKTALNFLVEGRQFYSDAAVDALLHGKPEPVMQPVEKIILTPREKEIVGLIAKELSNEQMAEKLFISLQTVETHRKNIMRKTEAKSAIGLVKMAMEKGWIER